MALADDGVTLPVAYAAAFVNDGRALFNADSIFERAAPLLPAGVVFAAHFLAAQAAHQLPARALVGVDVLVDAFVADGEWALQLELSADLFGGEVQAQVAVYLAPLLCIELACIAPCGLAAAGPLMRPGGLVALDTRVAFELAGDALAAAHELCGYDGWADVLARQCVDSVSFFSGQVLVGHRASFRLQVIGSYILLALDPPTFVVALCS